MSSESDSEVFFDAEDTTPIRMRSKAKNFQTDEKIADIPFMVTADMPVELCNSDEPIATFVTSSVNSETNSTDLPISCTVLSSEKEEEKVTFPVIQVLNDDVKECERKAAESEKRRRKIQKLRNLMLTDGERDEVLEVVPSDESSFSSVDGITLSNHSLEMSSQSTDEARSVISLGTVGLILGEKVFLPPTNERDSSSYDSTSMQTYTHAQKIVEEKTEQRSGPEPDVVASTKSITDPQSTKNLVKKPVAPPRTKRKKKQEIAETPTERDLSESSDVAEIVYNSPTAASNDKKNLSKYSLNTNDINTVIKGQYVVKPQDQEENKGEGPKENNSNISELNEVESISSFDNISIYTQSSSSKGSLKNRKNKSISGKDLKEESLPYIIRTRTDSGRPLTDQEILQQVKVLNLDTGEQIPLSLAEEHLPQCLNPLSLHIMRLTSEYVSNTALDKERESDEESVDLNKKSESLDASKMWSKTKEITKQLGRNIEVGVNKFKFAVADKVHHSKQQDDDVSGDDDDGTNEKGGSHVEVKISTKLKSVDKGRCEFQNLKLAQELSGEHTGAIWSMKFSSCGRLLCTAGQDHIIRIWVLQNCFKYFDDMRKKYADEKQGKSSPSPSQENSPTGTLEATARNMNLDTNDAATDDVSDNDERDDPPSGPFSPEPFCRYQGHTAELLDICWSKSYFLLSSSMDKTVRLWHISSQSCLCIFQHIDFVTAIAFHPRDDRFFLSGSLDGKLRLWNIPDKKVTLWNELDGATKLITAVNFCRNGKIAVVGSYDGRCIFYNTDQLKYYTQIHVRSSRGRNKIGRKISGIETLPVQGEDKILVTSNDSRIRLYDLRDLSLSCKYKGFLNQSSQIKASFSQDGRYIATGSENSYIYIWKTFHDFAKLSRRDRNDYFERIKAHTVGVTSAIFAPEPYLILKQCEDFDSSKTNSDPPQNCYVLVSADVNGTIKVFTKI